MFVLFMIPNTVLLFFLLAVVTAPVLKHFKYHFSGKRSAKIHIIPYAAIQYPHLKLLFNNIVISANCDLLKLLLTTKLYMAAAVGRRPLAQVLRNSLSGHPPSSATTRRRTWHRCHMDARDEHLRYKSIRRCVRRSELRPRITQYLTGRVRAS